MVFKLYFKLYLNGRGLHPQRTTQSHLSLKRVAELTDERDHSRAKGGRAHARRDAEDEEIKVISGGSDQVENYSFQRVRSNHL